MGIKIYQRLEKTDEDIVIEIKKTNKTNKTERKTNWGRKKKEHQ